MGIQGIGGIGPGIGGASAAESARALADAARPEELRAHDPSDSGGFGEMLGKAIDAMATQQKTADDKVLEVLTGRSDDYAGMMVAIHKAGLTFQLGLEVRNRAMDAYHEIMRMTV
jgi:flagellar hook-basal body complex protein FliE